MGEGPGGSVAAVLADLDLWAPVSTDALPPALVQAIEKADWAAAKSELGSTLDSLNTDGIYGRSLLQLARRLPLGVDPVLDRYRASVAIDYGDWDDLRRSMAATPIAAGELEMARSTFLAAVSDRPRSITASPIDALFLADELLISSRMGWLRQWARRLPAMDAAQRFSRPDVAAGRHFRLRQLHHAAMLAAAESHAGSLDTAAALGHEATRLGEDGEPLRDVASDIRSVALVAMGEAKAPLSLKLFERSPTPRGLSPLGTFQWIYWVLPFLVFLQEGVLADSVSLLRHVATRFGSPKMQLIAEAWSAAAQILSGARHARGNELRALVAVTRRADVGLRVLPELLTALHSQRYSGFHETERLARHAGMVWAQVTAMTWMVALDPTPRTGMRLARLLRASGWRRPVFVPEAILSDAALGLVSLDVRGQALIEFALASGRGGTATEVASRHATDPRLDRALRAVAMEALARIGTTHARRVLADVARDAPDVARLAGTVAERATSPAGLTDREVEVLDLAGQGLTNRQIAERLVLSHHTVARHLANARDKLGAANRADAAVRLGRLADRPLVSRVQRPP